MTGPNNQNFSLPVQCFCLSKQDYLRLLKACDLVITMSKVREGWCRVAHEAMLCQTPVIGSALVACRNSLKVEDKKYVKIYQRYQSW